MNPFHMTYILHAIRKIVQTTGLPSFVNRIQVEYGYSGQLILKLGRKGMLAYTQIIITAPTHNT